MFIATLIVWVLVIYAAVGLVFAVAFAARGAGTIDHAAKNARWHFRVLIVPGAAALWPLMAAKWRAARNHHP